MRAHWTWLLTFGVASASLYGLEHEASAQPSVRDHRANPPDRTAPPAPDDRANRKRGRGKRARSAPPAPQAEQVTPRAGYVWIPGAWDWKADKWEWTAGHFERERAGKSWREGRWDRDGEDWVYRDGGWIDANATPPTPTPPPVVEDPGPRAAPPPPRAEPTTPRAGYVWAEGQWDWKDSQWAWTPGHWERERAGKRWRAARWELRDGFYARIDGDWIDAGAPPPPPQDTGRPGPRRGWKIERPTVSSYWPIKGKTGARVTIRGKNFAPTTQVLWAGQPVAGAKITAGRITFVVPASAASGTVALRAGRGRDLVVGAFEVAASYDAEAAARAAEAELRRKAEAEWAARQQRLAKDRAAREAAARQREQELAATREQRRADRVAQIVAKYQRAFLMDDESRDELALHAQRIAELDRMRNIAEVSANGKLAVRIEILRGREDQRHSERMTMLEASFRANGGSR